MRNSNKSERAVQSTPELQLEEALVKKLESDLKYHYRSDIRNREALEKNFRQKFEDLNQVHLTDGEFQRLLASIVSQDVFKAANTLRNPETLTRDDGTPLNYTLVNIRDWCKNTYEVINQFRINTDYSQHRYDVILLINGIPVVQIELKRPGISSRRAMEQIVKYKNDPGNGYTRTLLCFVQLFIVSNRANTWYFTNNNSKYFPLNANERFLPKYCFADRNNKKISQLDDFADQFLPKCNLGQTISRHMVLIASEQKIMIMRPYQIYAVQAIIDCIERNCGNGYIWHTTGSGKTLTSFKASTLLKTNPNIHKCLFVVDRKDLDRQTRVEFNKFQENCVEENTNTANLVRRLLSDNYADKVIVTTIQKLALALDVNQYQQRLAPLHDQRMVFIFDECHRSQFGKNHQTIRSFFPNSQFFGFTGTPIFEDNASVPQFDGSVATFQTTRKLFQQELHKYTITHAIEDRNVLRFHVDYYEKKDTHERIYKQSVVEEILKKHDAATGNRSFNALFATSSINDAIEYHRVFDEIQTKRSQSNPKFKPLKIAVVFSPPAEGNKDVLQIQEDLLKEKTDNKQDPEGKKDALRKIIAEYNRQYGTSYDISNFDLYYQDVQQRIKDQWKPNGDLPNRGQEKIDITIVCDMLLTGFDSRYLNTLYLDKNLSQHGLIQAFSRTNRVLNSTKPFGNILDFRGQQESVDNAITLFSGVKLEKARKIWLVEDAQVVIDQFRASVVKLDEFMQSQGLSSTSGQANNLQGKAARVQFINLFRKIKRIRVKLNLYTDLTNEQNEEIDKIRSSKELQELQGDYLSVVERVKMDTMKTGGDDEPDNEEPDYELNLFASADIDFDYIMKLVASYIDQDPEQVNVTREQLIGLIRADSKFLDEREEIIEYVTSLSIGKSLNENDIKEGYEKFKLEKLAQELKEIAASQGLEYLDLKEFVDTILERMIFDGEQLTDLMLPLGLSWRNRRDGELDLMRKMIPYLKKRAGGQDIYGLNTYEQELMK